MRSKHILEKRARRGAGQRMQLLILVVSFSLPIAVIACGANTAENSAPAATLTVTVTPSPSPAFLPTAAADEQPSDQESTARANYLQNASRAIDLIGRTARLLGSIGIEASGVGDGPNDTKNLAEAAIGSFDLARLSLDAEPVPEGLQDLHMVILTSLRFYSEAARKLLDIPETGEFDFFEFQRPFETGGANFHEAGRLLAES